MGDLLTGRVAIVTGAGRGIGRGEALLLAEEGAAVVVNDRGCSPDGTGSDKAPADDVVDEILARRGQAVANYDSVADFAACERMVRQAIETFGRLDIVVNNAGILRDRMIFQMTEEEWDDVIGVHLKGTFSLTRHACAVFREQRSGVIINTSSDAGLGNCGQANYSAAKEGVIGFTRTVDIDMRRYNVRCNAIIPRAGTRLVATVATAAIARGATFQADRVEDYMKVNPPKDVAPLVVWLCSDQAARISGRVFSAGGERIGVYDDRPLIAQARPRTHWNVAEVEAWAKREFH